jgi:translation initiation factor IF-2
MPDSPTTLKTVSLPRTIVIRDLAEQLKVPITSVMKELLKNGIMSGMNERIDYDTAAIIAEDLGFKTEVAEAEVDESSAADIITEDKAEDLVPRAPVVVVMGHVDHGKTMLLDTIRKTKVMAGEAGGITQHIGAYQAVTHDRAITFLDTPGHEAFSNMRSRGARVADIAILVVAADDGVKPQTEEAIRTIQEAKLPYLVALNKIDKDEANPEKVKQELAAKNVLVEGYGGKVPVVPLSAKTGVGIDDLLDTVLLIADLDKDKLRANPNRQAIGTIIESKIDSGEGPIATALIHTGTLKVGEFVIAGSAFGKVKTLKSFSGETMKSAGPSTPVRILGLKNAPVVGDILQATEETKELKKKMKGWKSTAEAVAALKQDELSMVAHAERGDTEQSVVNIVLKADTLGSLEAIEQALGKFKHPEVSAVIIHKGLGNITEADVLRAQTSGALLMGFHVVVTPSADSVARGQEFTIETYKVIYDLIERVRQALESKLKPEVIEEALGKLNVLALFKNDTASQIVGGKVTDGKFVNQKKVHVMRAGKVIAEASIGQLQKDKQNATEVTSGNECGMKLQGTNVVQVGDTLECYDQKIIAPKLELPR